MKYPQNGSLDKANLGNVFWRTALGIIFLYLNFAAYQLLGIEGVAVTSGFFLIAQFAPFFLRMFGKRSNLKIAQAAEFITKQDDEKPGAKIIPMRLVSRAEQEV
ncbi:MAG: hypothetical protein H6964_01050 [Chromatiaceae bacterium]|nr:hypothetical protein [Gammaproteobacteria bacterium]MCB1879171.1 hypothetical protein [Gammaproteobacteria bacterium]MCP5445565.1 hypothetical protein [Chromatiaceae bacterium]